MSIANMLVLEARARQVAEATSKPPFLYEIGPEGARQPPVCLSHFVPRNRFASIPNTGVIQ